MQCMVSQWPWHTNADMQSFSTLVHCLLQMERHYCVVCRDRVLSSRFTLARTSVSGWEVQVVDKPAGTWQPLSGFEAMAAPVLARAGSYLCSMHIEQNDATLAWRAASNPPVPPTAPFPVLHATALPVYAPPLRSGATLFSSGIQSIRPRGRPPLPRPFGTYASRSQSGWSHKAPNHGLCHSL